MNNKKTNNRMMNNNFIIIEGVDGAGKTSMIKAALRLLDNDRIIYASGFNRESVWGRYINENPSSIKYYTDLAIKSQFIIRQKLASGHTILQDRYVQSIDTFLPDADYWRNKIFRRVFSRFFISPGFYVYVTASLDECINRLKSRVYDNDNETAYHKNLIADPESIIRRREMYDKIFSSYDCSKAIIDTSHKDIEDSAAELIEKLRVMKYVD